MTWAQQVAAISSLGIPLPSRTALVRASVVVSVTESTKSITTLISIRRHVAGKAALRLTRMCLIVVAASPVAVGTRAVKSRAMEALWAECLVPLTRVVIVAPPAVAAPAV